IDEDRSKEENLDFFHPLDQQKITFTSEAQLKLSNYYWNHNISELIGVVQKTCENLQGNIIDVNDLSIGEKKAIHSIFETDDDGLKLMSLKEAERLLIRKALIHTSENRTQAAKILGVSIRTLRNK